MHSYSAKRHHLPIQFAFDVLRNALEIEDEARKQLAVVLLPLSDRFHIIAGAARGLGVSHGFKFLLESGGWGPTTATQPKSTRFGIVNFDYQLLRRRLTIGEIALFAGVRPLPLPACASGA